MNQTVVSVVKDPKSFKSASRNEVLEQSQNERIPTEQIFSTDEIVCVDFIVT